MPNSNRLILHKQYLTVYCNREISSELCGTYMECNALNSRNVSKSLSAVLVS